MQWKYGELLTIASAWIARLGKLIFIIQFFNQFDLRNGKYPRNIKRERESGLGWERRKWTNDFVKFFRFDAMCFMLFRSILFVRFYRLLLIYRLRAYTFISYPFQCVCSVFKQKCRNRIFFLVFAVPLSGILYTSAAHPLSPPLSIYNDFTEVSNVGFIFKRQEM